MKIVILGAGAMGSTFGYKLKQIGNEVCLIDVWKDHVEAIRKNGLKIETKGEGTEIGSIDIVETPEAVKQILGDSIDLIIVFVKGTATDQAIRQALCIVDEHTMVLTLQNGVGNADVLNQYIQSDRVCFGTTTVGATIAGPGHVIYYPPQKETKTHIASMDGSITPEIEHVAEELTKAGLDTVVSAETEGLVWRKLVMNCIGNPMSVITRLYSCATGKDEDNAILTRQIISEICAVAEKKGLDLKQEEFEWIIPFTSTLERFPSMGYDAMNHKPTEIETINGAVVREGKRLGVPTPVNETLYRLVRLITSHYDELVY